MDIPPLLAAVIPCFVDLIDDPAGCHRQLVEFLRGEGQFTSSPPVAGSDPVGAAALHSPQAMLDVAPEILPTPPAPAPLANTTPVPNEPRIPDGTSTQVASGDGTVRRPATPPPVAGPSKTRTSSGVPIGPPTHPRRTTVPMMSTHIARPRQQPPRTTNSGKGKQKYRELTSGSEYEEEDELESEEESEGRVVKEEPISDHPGFQAYAREVQIEMELEEEAVREGRTPQGSAAKAPRRKMKAEPKTPAVVPDSDEEDAPTVVDRFAAAGENDPACLNCVGRNVTCQYVVDEWVTQCKLCQRQKVGCSISAGKVLALKNSGRKRPRAANGTTSRAPVKREVKAPKVPRPTPAPRKAKTKRAGLGLGSRRRENGEWSLEILFKFPV
jgi:hypothetical protein